MRVCARQIAQRYVAQAARQLRVVVDEPVGGGAREPHHDDVPDRVGRVQPLDGIVETETIAAEAELGDMAAAVRQQLGDANRAGDDLIPTIRTVPLAVDLLVAREVAARPDPLQRDERIERARPGDRRSRQPRRIEPIGKAAAAELPVHRSPPSLRMAERCLACTTAGIRFDPYGSLRTRHYLLSGGTPLTCIKVVTPRAAENNGGSQRGSTTSPGGANGIQGSARGSR
jgi:hypothetical protein